MIIIMQNGASDTQVEGVVNKLKELGLESNVSPGIERTVIGAIGDELGVAKEKLSVLSGVENVIRVHDRIGAVAGLIQLVKGKRAGIVNIRNTCYSAFVGHTYLGPSRCVSIRDLPKHDPRAFDVDVDFVGRAAVRSI